MTTESELDQAVPGKRIVKVLGLVRGKRISTSSIIGAAGEVTCYGTAVLLEVAKEPWMR
jgi:uncharacterized protein YbjQ (UPF0145 family)